MSLNEDGGKRKRFHGSNSRERRLYPGQRGFLNLTPHDAIGFTSLGLGYLESSFIRGLRELRPIAWPRIGEPFVYSLVPISIDCALTIGGIDSSVVLRYPNRAEPITATLEKPDAILQVNQDPSIVFLTGPCGIERINVETQQTDVIVNGLVYSADVSHCGRILTYLNSDCGVIVLSHKDLRCASIVAIDVPKMFDVTSQLPTPASPAVSIRNLGTDGRRSIIVEGQGKTYLYDMRMNSISTGITVGGSEVYVKAKWDMRTRSLISGYSRHESPICSVITTSNPDLFTTMDRQGKVKTWSISNATCLSTSNDSVCPNVCPIPFPIESSKSMLAVDKMGRDIVELCLESGDIKPAFQSTSQAQTTALGFFKGDILNGFLSGNSIGGITHWAPSCDE